MAYEFLRLKANPAFFARSTLRGVVFLRVRRNKSSGKREKVFHRSSIVATNDRQWKVASEFFEFDERIR